MMVFTPAAASAEARLPHVLDTSMMLAMMALSLVHAIQSWDRANSYFFA
jgi:hypothetical protein